MKPSTVLPVFKEIAEPRNIIHLFFLVYADVYFLITLVNVMPCHILDITSFIRPTLILQRCDIVISRSTNTDRSI